MPITYHVTTASKDSTGLRDVCQRYVESLWLPEHTTLDERGAMALDQFKRAVIQEMKLLEVECRHGPEGGGESAKPNVTGEN